MMNWFGWLLNQPLSVVSRVRLALYQRGYLQSHSLDAPVISVGNLTTGGTGKTPLVAYLAQEVLQLGLQPVILTRGYRSRAESSTLLACDGAGPLARPEDCGDEPFLLATLVPRAVIVVGSNRTASARRIRHRFPNPVYLLDDGYQHLQIRRQIDLLLIDVTRPFGNGLLLPFGPLREPKSAIRRASAVILTRTHQDPRSADRLRLELKMWNPAQPVFCFSHSFERAYDIKTTRQTELGRLASRPMTALVGIGNPAQFACDLRRGGFQIQKLFRYSDHHLYTQSELDRVLSQTLQAGADGIVTTEKDAVRLSSLEVEEGRIFALRILPQAEDRPSFESWFKGQVESLTVSGSVD